MSTPSTHPEEWGIRALIDVEMRWKARDPAALQKEPPALQVRKCVHRAHSMGWYPDRVEWSGWQDVGHE